MVDFIAKNTPIFLTVLILGMIFLEWGVLLVTKKASKNKEATVSIISAGLAFFPIFILQKIFLVGLMFWLYELRFFSLNSAWYVWLAAWVVYDFGFWLIHFLCHRVRLFWCIHAVHHQPKEMKLSVGFRGSFLDFLVTPHNIIWMPLLGFHPLMILIVDAGAKIYGVMVHINEFWVPTKHWKWFEWLFVSPSLHRAHHSTNHLYLDRNYGEALVVWDKMFGTIQPYLESDKLEYGIMKEVDSEDLKDSQLSELRSLLQDLNSTNSFSDKMKYIFMPPGWNHIDGGKLAEDFRNAAKLKRNGIAT
ncbi:MAG: hypothetical protein RL266_1335 [Bacteroidota bacterium]|jgi:sterol desaturase/sphingolipid hydroxylase (fatty acid hydroxylase superfamily)